MKRLILCVCIISACTKQADLPNGTSYEISPPPAITKPQPLWMSNENTTIMADRDYGGAITSLTYNGYEFVDISDHGREIQSALSFDDLGECFNPTEAGNVTDQGSQTTSKVLSAASTLDSIDTLTDAAFWLPPNYSYFHQCGTFLPIVEVAQNKTLTGGYLISKSVTFGNVQNSIRFKLQYTVPDAHTSGTFEFTGYLKRPYNQFYTWQNGSMVPLAAGEFNDMGEQPYPIIVTDGFTAMGVYSPQLPQYSWPQAGYGRWKFGLSAVNKWNMVWRDRQIPEGKTYKFDAYLCVGFLSEVQTCMKGIVP